MNHKRQNLPAFALLVVLAGAAVSAGVLAAGRTLLASDASDETAGSGAPAEPPVTFSDLTPEDVLNGVRGRLTDVSSLSCDLHETILVSGMKMLAAGRYVQGSGDRLRLEFRIFPITGAAAADRDAIALEADAPDTAKLKVRGSLTQVSNGDVMYSQWTNGDEVRASRRNIAQIVAAAGEVESYDANRVLSDMGVGGLKALISRIQSTMEFSRVRTESHGSAELLVLVGRWNKQIRTDFFQLQNDDDVIPVEFIPDYVRIYVDAVEHLPRRIQYLKRDGKPESKLVRPLLTLDFRNIVVNEPVDESLFQFVPTENVTEVDETEQTIQAIRRIGQPAPDAGLSVDGAGTPANQP